MTNREKYGGCILLLIAIILVAVLVNIVNGKVSHQYNAQAEKVGKEMISIEKDNHISLKAQLFMLLEQPIPLEAGDVRIPTKCIDALHEYYSSKKFQLSYEQLMDVLVKYKEAVTFLKSKNIEPVKMAEDDKKILVSIIDTALSPLSLNLTYNSVKQTISITDENERVIYSDSSNNMEFHYNAGLALVVFASIAVLYLLYFISSIVRKHHKFAETTNEKNILVAGKAYEK